MKTPWIVLRRFVDLDIRFKIIGLAIGSALLIITVVTLTTYSMKSRDLDNQMGLQTSHIAEDLAEKTITPLLTGDVFELHRLIESTIKDNPSVRYVFITDAAGNILHHSFEKGFPAGLAAANAIIPGSHARLKVLATDEGPVWDAAAPVLHGRAGTVRIGTSDKQYRSLLNAAIREQLLVTGAVTLLALTIATLLGYFISAQIKALAQAADAVAGGKLGEQVEVFGKDDLGRLSGAFNTMSSNLAEMRNKLEQKEAMRRQLVVNVIKAQEDERRRVARDLHDNLGQCLSSLGFGLQSATLALDSDPPKVRHFLKNLYEENLRSQNALRATIYAMRPSVLDDLGLIPALRSYAERRLAAQGIEVDLLAEGEDRRLPSEIETAVFRITQEALNNVVRHSGAKHVNVRAVLAAEGVDISITDDGHGFDAEKMESNLDGRSIGILGMRERAELLEGWVKIVSAPGRGCRVTVHIPVNENAYLKIAKG